MSDLFCELGVLGVPGGLGELSEKSSLQPRSIALSRGILTKLTKLTKNTRGFLLDQETFTFGDAPPIVLTKLLNE